MGFDSYHNRTPSPAKMYSRWHGGEGVLSHWDGSVQNSDGTQGKEVEEKLPFKFAILEQTRRISGFAPGKTPNSGTRYYSNETIEYADTMRVMAKEGDSPAREVAVGKYSDIKPNLPQGARLAIQLYVYVPERDQIEVITLQGASLSSFIEFSKKNKIYENYVTMERNEEIKTNGAVKYYEPTFKLAGGYTKEDLNFLSDQDKIVTDYMKGVRERQANNGDNGEAIDQTPSAYEGEQSQEVVVEEESSQEAPTEVDFGSIPF